MKKDSFRYNENDDLASVLVVFFRAMNAWEQWCLSEYERAKRENGDLVEFQERILQKREKIFFQYCTKKERKYGRMGSFRVPPEYDPELEKILDVVTESTSRAIIFTQQTSGFNLQCKYVLLRKHGKWLIDNKHWKSYDGKWTRGIL